MDALRPIEEVQHIGLEFGFGLALKFRFIGFSIERLRSESCLRRDVLRELIVF
jgi:hypothetical protein